MPARMRSRILRDHRGLLGRVELTHAGAQIALPGEQYIPPQSWKDRHQISTDFVSISG
ncbi:hypothetical protein [Kitasatospora sp. HPMI-4]|uniref:hypothetical protein n=1 Tax=Kitasatospora sp. HPMI-4 TaxID=3448443 RepID=UPI003F198E89